MILPNYITDFATQMFLKKLVFSTDWNIIVNSPKKSVLFHKIKPILKNWQYCFKRRLMKPNIRHVLRMDSAWGSTVYFNVFVPHLFAACNPSICERNYPISSISKYSIL